jgi:hypothetical protein
VNGEVLGAAFQSVEVAEPTYLVVIICGAGECVELLSELALKPLANYIVHR